jgi:hypothetical protein
MTKTIKMSRTSKGKLSVSTFTNEFIDFSCDRDVLAKVVDTMKHSRNTLPKKFAMKTFADIVDHSEEVNMCNTAGCLAGFVVASHYPDEWLKYVEDAYRRENKRGINIIKNGVTINVQGVDYAARDILGWSFKAADALFYLVSCLESDMLAVCEAILASDNMHINVAYVMLKQGWEIDELGR